MAESKRYPLFLLSSLFVGIVVIIIIANNWASREFKRSKAKQSAPHQIQSKSVQPKTSAKETKKPLDPRIFFDKESQPVKESIPEPKKIKKEKVIHELPLEDVILIQ